MAKYKKKIYIFILLALLPLSLAKALEPNDPGYEFQWYLEKINAPEAWEITTGKRDITIALLDSGVDIDHPDLKKNIWVNIDEINGDNIDNDRNGYIDDVHGWDFTSSTNNPNPQFDEVCLDRGGKVKTNCELGINHGTIIAGVASAIGNNKEGIAGASWNTKIMPLKVLSGTGAGESDKVSEAVYYAIENGADIINLSLMGDGYSKILEKALQEAYDKGIIIVAAAGNNDKGGININENPKYPICYKGKNEENIILGISGSDKSDNLAFFANYGEKCVDVSAPAVDFYSTSVFEPKYEGFESYYSGIWSGTSLATPLVSGLGALIKSIKPNLSNKNVYDLIKNNTDKIGNKQMGSGRINMAKTLSAGSINISNLVATDKNAYILAARQSKIRLFRNDGIYLKSFLAFDSSYQNGINLGSGDIDGDGNEEILAAKSSKALSEIRIFDGSGNIKNEFLAYGNNFKGGVNIFSLDMDSDGFDDIITGTGNGGGPQVRIFDGEGNIKSQFFAYNKNFRGGVNVAAGDFEGDGKNEIITGPGKSGRAHLRIFDKDGNAKSQFFAYPENFKGGVNVAVGDLDGNGKDEIIAAPLSGGGPHIKIFTCDGKLISHFFAFEKDFHGGINIFAKDIDGDGKAEIIASRKNGKSEIKIFDFYGSEKLGFYPFESNSSGGTQVTILKN